MDQVEMDFLTDIRQKMFHGESEKQKEIINKIDELILTELNKELNKETTQDQA